MPKLIGATVLLLAVAGGLAAQRGAPVAHASTPSDLHPSAQACAAGTPDRARVRGGDSGLRMLPPHRACARDGGPGLAQWASPTSTPRRTRAPWGPRACATGCEQDSPRARFSAQVQLVEVYATVTDASGQLLTGLRREDFEVYENNQLQAVSTFTAGEFPLTVALGVDRSWSMAGDRLRLARQASQSFLRALKPADRSMVVAISNEAEVLAPLTMDRLNQERAIAALDPWSTTALHDAIIATLDRLAPEPGRQALVVFSDGEDRYSRAGAAEVVERARRSNALIYPIALGRTRPPLLAALAVLTGGRSFLLRDVRDLEKTLAEVARELRYQYLLGYAPAQAIDPATHEWRAIRVVVKRPGVRVRARDGYMT